MQIDQFTPTGSTVNAAVTGTTGALALTAPQGGASTVRLTNIGTQTVFVTFGGASAAGVLATSMPLLANTSEVFALGSATHVGHIAVTTGSTLYATTGTGV